MQYGIVDKAGLSGLLGSKALVKELEELAKILKCKPDRNKKRLADNILARLYKAYQTPIGYIVRKPTLDAMCDRVAKKLKLAKLEGTGWKKLHSLSVNVFEKILASMPKKEKEKLLKEMWDRMSPEDRKKIKKEFHVADVSQFIHSSEMLAAHVVGVHLAREAALYTAAAILKTAATAELALAASTVLTRTATVFLGPVGWALLAVSVNDLMGTNFKVVVPALLTINIINIRVHGKKLRDKM